MNEKLLPLILLGVSFGGECGAAQAPAVASVTPAPAFDVASVKPSSADARGQSLLMSQGRFTTENEPLKGLIQFAYNLKSDDELIGAPGWVDSKRFDIEAKEDAAFVEEAKNLSSEQRVSRIRLMVQALLLDRFHLQVSHQTRELPVYALVIARGGPKMTPTPVQDLPPSRTTPPAPGDTPPRRRGSGVRMNGRGDLMGMAATMDVLTTVLSHQPETGGRLVVNKTALTGAYDWTLKWTPDPGTSMAGPGDAPPPESTGPSFFTAIQEQLGLKLESQKAPVAVVVIDHIELPSAN